MDIRVKHRLIGAAVIVVLGIIFIPMLFEGHHTRTQTFTKGQSTQEQASTLAAKKPDIQFAQNTQQDKTVFVGNSTEHVTDNIAQQIKPIASQATPQQKVVKVHSLQQMMAQPKTQEQELAHESATQNSEQLLAQARQALASAKRQLAKVEASESPHSAAAPQVKANQAKRSANQTHTQRHKQLPKQEQAIDMNRTVHNNPDILLDTVAASIQAKSKTNQATHRQALHSHQIAKIEKPQQVRRPVQHHRSQQPLKNREIDRVSHQRAAATSQQQEVWMLQIASFSRQANAERLLNKLLARGFSAFAKRVRLANGRHVIRVYVGPSVSRHHAKNLIPQVYKAVHLRGMLIKKPYTKNS